MQYSLQDKFQIYGKIYRNSHVAIVCIVPDVFSLVELDKICDIGCEDLLFIHCRMIHRILVCMSKICRICSNYSNASCNFILAARIFSSRIENTAPFERTCTQLLDFSWR